MRVHELGRGVFACALLVVGGLVGESRAQWTVTVLHPGAGSFRSMALGVSGGQQVGESFGNLPNVGALLWSGSAASVVPLAPGITGSALGVSNGVQVGMRANHASMWTGTPGSVVDLHPAGASISAAIGIGGGQQAGSARFGTSDHAGIWTGSAGSWIDMNPAGAQSSWAECTSGGIQVGTANFAGGAARAGWWRGTAGSWTPLHPAGWSNSFGYATCGTQQVGHAVRNESLAEQHAFMWRGTPASAVDLHPTGMFRSSANGTSCGMHVGSVLDAPTGAYHASVWGELAQTWEDLHYFLPPEYTESYATAIDCDASGTHVVGWGYNANTGREEALMWSRPTVASNAGAWAIVSPPPRDDFKSAAFDTARGVVVMGGGRNESGTVWEGTEGQWSPRTGVAAGYEFPMVFDAARGVVVRYGGRTPSGARSALTLVWNGTLWVPGTGISPPGARSGHAMAYDPIRQEVVMFGGRVGGGAGTLSAETWVWNGTSWAQRLVVGPSAREDHAMAFHAGRGVVVLFGGRDNAGLAAATTYEWNGSGWVASAALPPAGRWGHTLTYDAARNAVVLLGGNTSAFSLAPTSQTLEYSAGGVWNFSSGIYPACYRHAAAYDTVNSKIVMFGGSGATGEWLDKTWLRTALGQMVLAAGASPPSRGHVSEFDESRGVTVLMPSDGGGPPPGSITAGRVYERSGGAWREISPVGSSPAERYGHMLAYSDGLQQCVIHGGIAASTGTYFGDTWRWSGSQWTLLGGGGPGARSFASMSRGPNGTVVLFGGNAGAPPTSDTWELSASGVWTQRAVSGPSARNYGAMAYDSRRGVVVMFGGVDAANATLTDTWEWNGTMWARREVSGPPGVQPGNSAMAYDASRGVSSILASDQRVWDWDGCLWTQRPAGGPAVLIGSLVYDSVEKRDVFVGLANGVNSSTWTLSVPCAAPVITQQPEEVIACSSSTARFSVGASGSALRYQWVIVPESDPDAEPSQLWGGFESSLGGIVSGTMSPTLHIKNPTNRGWLVGCIVSSGNGLCGDVLTDLVPLRFCVTDLDDGTGGGVPDCGTDVNDLLYFLGKFEEGDLAVDLDDGNGLGQPDGGVDINDLLFFLAHFELGC